MRVMVLLCALWLLSAGPGLAGETLKSVKSARMLRCGVSTGVPGFSERDGSGRWSGVDVDFCRAVAAAAFGDPQRVAFKPLPTLARFPALMSGEVDLLARNTTWTVGRSAGMGITFTGPLVYSSQGVMVHTASGITRLDQLEGKTICVVTGSTQDASLNYYARRKGLHLEKIAFDNDDDARKGYFEGACQAYASDAFLLAAMRLRAPGGQDAHGIITEPLTMDPLSPAVRQDDNEWRHLVEAVWAALLLAEEFDLAQASFAPGAPSHPAMEAFAGKSDALAKALGVEPGWAARAVAAGGNYGEIFERNLGKQSPLGLDRGANRLWSHGGLMIPPGF